MDKLYRVGDKVIISIDYINTVALITDIIEHNTYCLYQAQLIDNTSITVELYQHQIKAYFIENSLKENTNREEVNKKSALIIAFIALIAILLLSVSLL